MRFGGQRSEFEILMYRVWGLGFRVHDSGFTVDGLVLRRYRV